ncbi:MAG: MFS transporter [Chloroflexi bacterium]|nr:MFS transporter [Chloroflexota bacterium]
MATEKQPEIVKDETTYPRYRWVVLGLMVLTQEVSVLLVGATGMLLPSMRKDLGFGAAESGMLGALSQLASLLIVPATLFFVRFRPKRVYFVALILASAAGFFIGQSPVFLFLAAFFFLKGLALMIRQIPDTLLRFQWIPKKEFATVMGLTMGLMNMGQSTGIMIVPFLLILVGGWRNLFSVYALVLALTAIVWAVFARERITPAYQQGMARQDGHSPLRNALKRKEFTMLGIALFGGTVAYTVTMLFLPTYLLEERGLPLTTIGVIVGLLPIGGVCANITMGFISDRIGLRKPTMWPPGLFEFLFYFSLFSPVPVWALFVLAFATGYAAWAPMAAIRSIPFELPGVKPSEIAVGQSMIQTLTTLGTVLGAPLAGFLADSLGSVGTALRIMVVFSLTKVTIGFLIPETGIKARSAALRELEKG